MICHPDGLLKSMIPTHHRRRQLLTSLPGPLRVVLIPLIRQKGWQAFVAVTILLCIIKYKVDSLICLLYFKFKVEGN